MNHFNIIQAGPDRAPEVVNLVSALLRELGEEGEETGSMDLNALASSWQENELGHRAFLAMDEGGSPVGVATVSIAFALYANGNYGIINEMYVVPEFRSHGVGALLVQAVIAFGRENGWRRLDVTAPEADRWIRTREFYERQGFAFTGPKLKFLLT